MITLQIKIPNDCHEAIQISRGVSFCVKQDDCPHRKVIKDKAGEFAVCLLSPDFNYQGSLITQDKVNGEGERD